MPYQRVLPRDLFNESKLLKCLGQVALLLHDREGAYPIRIEHEDDEYAGFDIDQEPSMGDLYCSNLWLYVRGDRVVYLAIRYNSKRPYPLYFLDEENDESGPVLQDDGQFTREFLDFIGDPVYPTKETP